MADENKEPTQTASSVEQEAELAAGTELTEFDGKSTAKSQHKDLWLFLIIADAVLLCFFGVLLYQNVSASLLNSSSQTPVAEAEEVITVAEEVVIPSAPAEPVTVAKAKPVEPEPVKPVEVIVEEVAEAEVINPAAKPEIEAKAAEEQTFPREKKQSVLVSVNPKSKYRQVTFRYFDKAKSVAVVSGFTMAKPRAMTQKDGVWEVTLAIAPGTYKYLFVVDGKQRTDPYAEEKDGRSLLVLE